MRELISNSSDLTSQLRYATNAFKLYRKTRPGAAPESVKRAKLLPQEGIHPLLAASVPSRALGVRSCTVGDIVQLSEKLHVGRH